MYTNIELNKSLYNITGKTFTQALEELDPDKNYENTPLKGLDAYERQLKRFNIHVSGVNSDLVEKFFVSTQSAILFPEYIRRMIKKGIDEVCIAPRICAAVTQTDSNDYRGLVFTENTSENYPGEAVQIPVTTVRLASTTTALTKYARILDCSYESMRKQRLEAFGVALRELGATIAREINAAAVAKLKAGLEPHSYTSVSYLNIMAFWNTLVGHNMDIILASPKTVGSILGLTEIKGSTSTYSSDGCVTLPFGVTLMKCDSLADTEMVGLDSSCAAELILGSDIIIDTDKIIGTQCDQISCLVYADVSKLNSSALSLFKKI